MPSIFSRSRTPSAPSKKQTPNSPASADEFGRVSSRASNHAATVAGKKDKDTKDKKRDKEKTRLRTISSPNERDRPGADPPEFQIPDGSFLSTDFTRPQDESGADRPKENDYGYLSYERHVVLGLDDVARLVDVVALELSTRGLTTSFIFSALALDVSAPETKRLIRAFLTTCRHPGAADAERYWREEARLAGPHELGMCIRWGLARVVRVVGGQLVRGLISWDHYLEFRDSEAALNYPAAHFATFLPPLPPVLKSILLTLLNLLTRFIAHSASSGHTPPTLSPLFGPLFFGLGPATLAFHHTYVHYLRAVNAMEHILLAYIRWQDSPQLITSNTSGVNPSSSPGSAMTLGVPTRLKDWIKGYPTTLPFLSEKSDSAQPFLPGKHKMDKPRARRGARIIRVVSVRRNVRMYSPDLVKTAATWAQRPRSSPDDRGLAGSKEWDRIAPPSLKLPPRYSEGYKKRMNLGPNFHPDTGTGMTSMPSSTSSNSSSSSPLMDDGDLLGLGVGFLGREGGDRFRSLTDLKWGEFEATGFGGLGADEKKLQFDLTEGARLARAAKRATLTWNDFSATGFSRTDAPLNATLQFSTPITHTITSWPSHNADITRKLKKTHRSLPSFGWDTEPVMGSEEVIEEAFLDVFCDLVYGGGWMDVERAEDTDRECNWALIEFKSSPLETRVIPGTDPRTSTTLILFEEFVPLEYRQKLLASSTRKRRLPLLFSPGSKSKQWKPATTLNGRPYVIGAVPRSPHYREVEIEGLIRGNDNSTRMVSLSGPHPAPSSAAHANSPVSNEPAQISRYPLPTMVTPNAPATPVKTPAIQRVDSPLTPISATKKNIFRLPGGIAVPTPSNRRSVISPAEYSTVEFETRLASYSDDEFSGATTGLTPAQKQERRMSKDDAWVDILVATHNRRMGSQDAEGRKDRLRGLKGGRSDPEVASQEVAQALAGIRSRSPVSDDEEMELVADPGLDDQSILQRRKGEDSNGNGLEEEDPDIDSVMSYPKKRLGYFDLHPERRPRRDNMDGSSATQVPSRDSSDEDDELIYGPPDDILQEADVPMKVRTSIDTDDSIYPPTPSVHQDRDIDIPEFENSEGYREEQEREPSRIDSATLPQLLTSSSNGTKAPAQSKTAALIEMYREREKNSALDASPGPSRIPVLSPPSQAEENLSLPQIASNPSPPSPSVPSVDSNSELEMDPLCIEPPHLTLEDTGRASPGRYVHGAPLHNVAEEDEEDEM